MRRIEDLTNEELKRQIAELEKQAKAKTKKPLTERQKEVLRIGREKRRRLQIAKQYKKAVRKQLQIKRPDENIITYNQFNARVNYVMREFGITRQQAIKRIMTSRLFMTQDELFKNAIKSFASLSDFTKIRSYIWQILKEENPEAVKKGWITYQTTKINWDEFLYDSFMKALIYSRNGRKIIIKVVKGRDSTDPDWLSIELI